MKFLNVILNFSRNLYNDLELIAKATLIGQRMANNPHFVIPSVPIEVLMEGTMKLTESVTKANDGSKEDTVLKNRDRSSLETILQQLGLYVQTISQGKEDIILSAGFDLHKKAAPVGALEQPLGLIVEQDSNSGVVHVSCNVVEHASSYKFEYTEAPIQPQSVWLDDVSTKHQTTFNGLTSGQIYIFRVTGIGADPTRKSSEPVSRMVI